jgi:hypothetical protein
MLRMRITLFPAVCAQLLTAASTFADHASLAHTLTFEPNVGQAR